MEQAKATDVHEKNTGVHEKNSRNRERMPRGRKEICCKIKKKEKNA